MSAKVYFLPIVRRIPAEAKRPQRMALAALPMVRPARPVYRHEAGQVLCLNHPLTEDELRLRIVGIYGRMIIEAERGDRTAFDELNEDLIELLRAREDARNYRVAWFGVL